MFHSVYDALYKVHDTSQPDFTDFVRAFAPIPDNSGSLALILELLGLGAIMLAAPYFNSCKYMIRKLLYMFKFECWLIGFMRPRRKALLYCQSISACELQGYLLRDDKCTY